MLKPQNGQKHVAVFAFPFSSHVPPLLALTRKLSEAAPDVKFSFFSTAQSNGSLFSDGDEFPNIKSYNVDTGLPEGYVFKGAPPSEPVEYFLKETPGNFERALEKAVGETGMEISCLITDVFLWFAADMAEEKRVPWISFYGGGPRAMLVHLETDNLRNQMGMLNGAEDPTMKIFPGFTLPAADVPNDIISESLDSPISQMLYRMAQKLPHADAVVMNSVEELDPTPVDILNSRMPKLFNVGPFALVFPQPAQPDLYGCLEWLASQNRSSVAYISFGTVANLPPPELTALAEALEESKVPFLWSLRGNVEEQLPEGFSERTRAYGKIVPWVPQLKVLAHSSVGVNVTHCGWKSVMESIIGGVPMIGRSIFGDQGTNKWTMERVWGIGLGVEGGKFTKDGTMRALKVVLSSEEGKKMREKIGVLKELACQAVESEGSSTANFKALIEVITKI